MWRVEKRCGQASFGNESGRDPQRCDKFNRLRKKQKEDIFFAPNSGKRSVGQLELSLVSGSQTAVVGFFCF